MENFGFKDFESVCLKATYNIEIGNKIIEEGETIAFFDKIQIAGLNELKEKVSANGGYGNRARVWWDTTQDVKLTFSQGIFSKEQFALLTNSRLVNIGNDEYVSVSMREVLESNEDGEIECKYTPARNIYVYRVEDGSKLAFTQNGNKLIIDRSFVDVIVDYEFDYIGDGQIIKIGQRLLTGFVSLEGKTRVKDDTTGQVVTGIIKIPHLKLMSDLSIRLGAQANPVVANFSAVGVPVGSRGNTYVSEFYLLGDDIESDL